MRSTEVVVGKEYTTLQVSATSSNITAVTYKRFLFSDVTMDIFLTGEAYYYTDVSPFTVDGSKVAVNATVSKATKSFSRIFKTALVCNKEWNEQEEMDVMY